MNPPEIRFIFYWDYDVSIRAGRALLAFREGPRWLRAAWLALAAAAVLSLVMIAIAPAEERGTRASNLLPLLFATACGLAFFRYALLTDRAYAFREMPDADRPITVTITDEGYTTASYSGSGTHPWTAFRGARETDEFILILFRGRGAYYIPKRAAPADDLDPIRALLRGQFGQEARLMDAPAADPHPSVATEPA
ncbi:MAG TPA: YcxB family protein [Longimicrobium sp.]|nr:YcxB family protein [Longimicrobium sp.]